MFWATVEWNVKPDQHDAFVDAWAQLVLASKGAFPARRAFLVKSRTEPHLYLSMSAWPDDSLIDGWRKLPAIVEAYERLFTMAERGDRQDFDQVIDVG